MNGILVPGGFGSRGVEGKILAVKYARENNIPYFGICYGMHMAVIEFARNVLNLEEADTNENIRTRKIRSSTSWRNKNDNEPRRNDAARRFSCRSPQESLVSKIYGKEQISERHRHRYEFNNDYREKFEDAGMALSGISPNGLLVEIVELRNHPWFMGVQFHPEFKSRPVDPHPLFREFVAASLKRRSD